MKDIEKETREICQWLMNKAYERVGADDCKDDGQDEEEINYAVQSLIKLYRPIERKE
jgi:hypothetical protein